MMTASDDARAWLGMHSRRGFCEETEFDAGASCRRGRKGAWPLRGQDAASMVSAAAACLALCRSCARCRFISVARVECSWFRDCAERVNVQGGHAFRSGRVPGASNASGEVGAPDNDAPWSPQAAADSRSVEWPAAARIFAPLVATPRRIGRSYVGVGVQFGEPHPAYWEYLQVTLTAWRQRANASLIILTDQAPLMRSRVRRPSKLTCECSAVPEAAPTW